MAVRKSTLARSNENTDEVQYIYPRTSADNVQYDGEISVKEKIDSMLIELSDLRTARSTVESLYTIINLDCKECSLTMDGFNKINLDCKASNYNIFEVKINIINIEDYSDIGVAL